MQMDSGFQANSSPQSYTLKPSSDVYKNAIKCIKNDVKHWKKRNVHIVPTLTPPLSGSQRWGTSVGTLRSFWLAARLTSGRIKSARGSSRPRIRPPSLTHRYDPANLQPHATVPTLQPCGVINGLMLAGWGDSAADERRALPGVFGKVSGECGRNIQGGYQKNFGFYPQTEESQEEEEMCHLVTTAVGLRTGGECTNWWKVK